MNSELLTEKRSSGILAVQQFMITLTWVTQGEQKILSMRICMNDSDHMFLSISFDVFFAITLAMMSFTKLI